MTHVNYSMMDLAAANAINQVFSEVANRFGIKINVIRPYEELGLPRHQGMMGVISGGNVGYNKNYLGPDFLQWAESVLQLQKHTSQASKTIRALAAHEVAHILQESGRTSRGAPLGVDRSLERVRRIVEDYRQAQGRDRIFDELGDRAWRGDPNYPNAKWMETWAQAFSAYWTDPNSASKETVQMVEKVLRTLYPEKK